MGETLIPLPEGAAFDLAATLHSGQVFHWEALPDGGFAGAIGDTPVWLRQTSAGILTSPETAALVRRYLALDHDISAICRSFPPHDAALAQAVAFCPGLRILRQPRWECLATFITSSLKQVPHIRQISLTLRRRYGARHECAGAEVFTYPTPAALAEAGESALRACALGYRAKLLVATAQRIASGAVDLEKFAALPDAALRAELCQLPGVGPKIADCVSLFAYERLAAFPIDVWIERTLRTLYFRRKRRVTAQKIRDFATHHFGPYAGYAQQFLFHHARLTKLEGS